MNILTRALDAKSLNNFILTSPVIEKTILKMPNISEKLKYYKNPRKSLDYETLNWLHRHMSNLRKLVVGTIKLKNPWKELTKFKNLETMGFTLKEYNYFPREQLKIKKLEIHDYSMNTKSYIDSLLNFKNLTKIKLRNARITTDLLATLNQYRLEELHLLNCEERFDINENGHIHFSRLKELSILQLHSMKPSKLFMLYNQSYEPIPDRITINISYSGEDTAYIHTYNPQKIEALNIYVNQKIGECPQQLIRFVVSLNYRIKVTIKIFKDCIRTPIMETLVNKLNDIRDIIQLNQ